MSGPERVSSRSPSEFLISVHPAFAKTYVPVYCPLLKVVPPAGCPLLPRHSPNLHLATARPLLYHHCPATFERSKRAREFESLAMEFSTPPTGYGGFGTTAVFDPALLNKSNKLPVDSTGSSSDDLWAVPNISWARTVGYNPSSPGSSDITDTIVKSENTGQADAPKWPYPGSVRSHTLLLVRFSFSSNASPAHASPQY